MVQLTLVAERIMPTGLCTVDSRAFLFLDHTGYIETDRYESSVSILKSLGEINHGLIG